MSPWLEREKAGQMVAPPESGFSLGNALRNYSIELGPKEAKSATASLARLDPGTEVYLTWIPGSDPMEMVGFAANLRTSGFIAVPHIGARHVESRAQLESLARRLSGEAGVDRVLIIGGDRGQPVGPYESTISVMQTGIFQEAGIERIAVAGFPEGNPNIPDQVLDQALAAKVSFAQQEGLQLSVVTQFCFDAGSILNWIRKVRAASIDVPIRIGMAGPASLVTLTRYAIRCGVGASLHVLTEKPSFAKLLVDKGPEPVVRGILSTTESGSAGLPPGVAGFHFFVFGGLAKTMDWISAERNE